MSRYPSLHGQIISPISIESKYCNFCFTIGLSSPLVELVPLLFDDKRSPEIAPYFERVQIVIAVSHIIRKYDKYQ